MIFIIFLVKTSVNEVFNFYGLCLSIDIDKELFLHSVVTFLAKMKKYIYFPSFTFQAEFLNAEPTITPVPKNVTVTSHHWMLLYTENSEDDKKKNNKIS